MAGGDLLSVAIPFSSPRRRGQNIIVIGPVVYIMDRMLFAIAIIIIKYYRYCFFHRHRFPRNPTKFESPRRPAPPPPPATALVAAGRRQHRANRIKYNVLSLLVLVKFRNYSLMALVCRLCPTDSGDCTTTEQIFHAFTIIYTIISFFFCFFLSIDSAEKLSMKK